MLATLHRVVAKPFPNPFFRSYLSRTRGESVTRPGSREGAFLPLSSKQMERKLRCVAAAVRRQPRSFAQVPRLTQLQQWLQRCVHAVHDAVFIGRGSFTNVAQ